MTILVLRTGATRIRFAMLKRDGASAPAVHLNVMETGGMGANLTNSVLLAILVISVLLRAASLVAGV